MATVFRESMNILASLESFLNQQLLTDSLDNTWSVIFGFKEVYDTQLPIICIRTGISNHNFIELGSIKTTRDVSVFIDIFARNEMEKFDIKDWIIDNIRNGFDYFEHVIEDNGDVTEIVNGKVIILSINEDIIDLNTDKDNLDEHDQYRYRINLTTTTGKVS